MSIASRGQENRTAEIEIPNDGCRTEVEMLFYHGGDFRLIHFSVPKVSTLMETGFATPIA